MSVRRARQDKIKPCELCTKINFAFRAKGFVKYIVIITIGFFVSYLLVISGGIPDGIRYLPDSLFEKLLIVYVTPAIFYVPLKFGLKRVYVHQTGYKYHTNRKCQPGLSGMSIKVAKSMGYELCGNCAASIEAKEKKGKRSANAARGEKREENRRWSANSGRR
jgi:hypothetical protein